MTAANQLPPEDDEGTVAELPVFTRRPATPGLNPHEQILRGLAGPTSLHAVPADGLDLAETADAADAEPLDWRRVASLRRRVSTRLDSRIEEIIESRARAQRLDVNRDREMVELSQAEREELGRDVILEVIDADDVDSTNAGQGTYSLDYRDRLAQALFDEIFGLGRLQPLLRDPTIQNIVIAGDYTRCFVYRDDGSIDPIAPFAESDEDLIDILSALASKGQGGNARPFSPAVPDLHLRLQDGSRLAAASWIGPGTSMVIRCHRLKSSSLDDLVARGMMTPLLASFLSAATQAGKNIIITGDQGSGKTTLMRAMCGEIPPWVSIATIETNAELFLDQFPERHWMVHAFEERPGMGEIGPDGQQAGAYSLGRALTTSQRMQAGRTFVGEVRGSEIWVFIKALESGGGGMCTTHAIRADAAIEKLVTCAQEFGSHVTDSLARSKLASVIDLVVHLGVSRSPKPGGGWKLDHWVDEVLAVGRGESGTGLAMTPIFKTDRRGRVAKPRTLPDDMRDDLEDFGFDAAAFHLEGGIGDVE